MRILHTCIRVYDLEKSLNFYKSLGFNVVREVKKPQAGFDLVYLSDEAGDFELELTYNYQPSKPYELGNGYSHLAIGVDNLEEEHARHKELGYEVSELKTIHENQAPNYYFVKDPDGYLVEVIRN